ncbi:MAG: hypothetical protein NXI32_23335 [bacterium]|nr:hypothetical protein [bacterium]
MKFYFVLLVACAGYFSLVREAGFTSANALMLFLLGLSSPVWVSFGYIYWEMKTGYQPRKDRQQEG